MAVALVQSAALGATSSAASQQTGAFGAQPTVGNYIVAWAWGWTSGVHTSSTAFTFSDTGGNTYTVPANCIQQTSLDFWCVCGYAKVATAGASFKVTVTSAGGGAASGSMMVVAREFSGVAASSPLDGTPAGAAGTTGVPAPGSMAITAGSLVAAIFSSNQTTYDTFGYATPAGFTRAGYQNDGSTFQVGEGVYALGLASPSAPSWKTSTVRWGAAQFALLAAASAFDPATLPGPTFAPPPRAPWRAVPY